MKEKFDRDHLTFYAPSPPSKNIEAKFVFSTDKNFEDIPFPGLGGIRLKYIYLA